ncbi:hypothetical protein DFS34DRAFT_622500 [Phlyctochytrium arcticum]|nr:hypothetical protein DFS34DRAFT_622500 [Phlyctochytrium arcticum]
MISETPPKGADTTNDPADIEAKGSEQSIDRQALLLLENENRDLRQRLMATEEDLFTAATFGQHLLKEQEKLRSHLRQYESSSDLGEESPEALTRRNSTKRAGRQLSPRSPRRLTGKRIEKPQSPRKRGLIASPQMIDPHLASDIDNHLLNQLRNLQSQLGNMSEARQELQEENDALEEKLDALQRQYEKSNHTGSKLDERLWDLELNNQQLRDQLAEAEAETAKLHNSLKGLDALYRGSLEQIEYLKSSEQNSNETKEQSKIRLEMELSRSKRAIEILETEKEDLVRTCEELVRKAAEDATFPRYDLASSQNSSLQFSRGMDFDDDKLSAAPSSLMISSPDRSPTKHNLFVESLSASLSHAHLQIKELEDNAEKDRAERSELSRLLALAQETIDILRSGRSTPQDKSVLDVRNRLAEFIREDADSQPIHNSAAKTRNSKSAKRHRSAPRSVSPSPGSPGDKSDCRTSPPEILVTKTSSDECWGAVREKRTARNLLNDFRAAVTEPSESPAVIGIVTKSSQALPLFGADIDVSLLPPLPDSPVEDQDSLNVFTSPQPNFSESATSSNQGPEVPDEVSEKKDGFILENGQMIPVVNGKIRKDLAPIGDSHSSAQPILPFHVKPIPDFGHHQIAHAVEPSSANNVAKNDKHMSTGKAKSSGRIPTGNADFSGTPKAAAHSRHSSTPLPLPTPSRKELRTIENRTAGRSFTRQEAIAEINERAHQNRSVSVSSVASKFEEASKVDTSTTPTPASKPLKSWGPTVYGLKPSPMPWPLPQTGESSAEDRQPIPHTAFLTPPAKQVKATLAPTTPQTSNATLSPNKHEDLKSSVMSVTLPSLPAPPGAEKVPEKHTATQDADPQINLSVSDVIQRKSTIRTSQLPQPKRAGSHRRGGNMAEHSPSMLQDWIKRSGRSTSTLASNDKLDQLSEYGSEGQRESKKAAQVANLTYTMIGSWFQKFNRRNRNPQLRYFWVNPYSRALNWANKPPSQGKKNMQTRTAFIKSIKWDDPDRQYKNYPPGPEHAVIIQTPHRTVRIVPTNWYDHERWTSGLSLLLERTHRPRPLHEQFGFMEKEGDLVFSDDDDDDEDDVDDAVRVLASDSNRSKERLVQSAMTDDEEDGHVKDQQMTFDELDPSPSQRKEVQIPPSVFSTPQPRFPARPNPLVNSVAALSRRMSMSFRDTPKKGELRISVLREKSGFDLASENGGLKVKESSSLRFSQSANVGRHREAAGTLQGGPPQSVESSFRESRGNDEDCFNVVPDTTAQKDSSYASISMRTPLKKMKSLSNFKWPKPLSVNRRSVSFFNLAADRSEPTTNTTNTPTISRSTSHSNLDQKMSHSHSRHASDNSSRVIFEELSDQWRPI